MAKSRTKAKRYAVQRHMEIQGLIQGDSSVHWLDVGRWLSESNHRLYRQSRVYKAKVNSLGMAAPRAKLHVYVLRDTWFLQKSIQLAKDTFDKNMSEERDVVNAGARWQDFRLDLSPRNNSSTQLFPVARYNTGPSGATYALNNGEFTTSRVFDESGSSYVFGLRTTGTGDTYSVVEEYDKTANTSDDPSSTPSSSVAAYDGLDADVQAAARDDLMNRGNSPPYDADNLDGDKLFRKVAVLGGTGLGNQKMSTGFFEAPMGLVVLVTEDLSQAVGSETSGEFELEVAGGDYKGVHASEYIEAKKFGHRRG